MSASQRRRRDSEMHPDVRAWVAIPVLLIVLAIASGFAS